MTEPIPGLRGHVAPCSRAACVDERVAAINASLDLDALKAADAALLAGIGPHPEVARMIRAHAERLLPPEMRTEDVGAAYLAEARARGARFALRPPQAAAPFRPLNRAERRRNTAR
jgi:hypothetical protein